MWGLALRQVKRLQSSYPRVCLPPRYTPFPAIWETTRDLIVCVDFVVDLSGWDDDTHSISPEGTMWLNNGTFAEPNDLDPEITFDLGGVVSLDQVKVWNYNEELAGSS